jgi:hypothetical protein
MAHRFYKLKFRTAYSQFYLCDKNPLGSTDSDAFWTEQAFNDKLAIEDGIVGVCIGTYSYVKCQLALLHQQPDEIDFGYCDHVVEGSLRIGSGVLQVLDCPYSAVMGEFDILPGCYRVRVKAMGLNSIVDEDEEAEDTYSIELWPAATAPRRVLKKSAFPY